MMATAEPPSSSSLLPLLESLEDSAAGQSEHTDAYLTIANRLSGEEARQFLPAVEKHFSRLGKSILTHVTSPSAELSQAALQALGFCVYHSQVVSGLPEAFAAEILSALCSLVVKSTDKNTCTRALWVVSKQSFPPDVVSKKVPSILGTLDSVWSREDIQSVVMEHEALNVIIRLLEQVPAPMGDGAVKWAKLVIPLVVHSASKVRLRAAAAMEMGMPLLLEKQTEVAAIIEPMMATKLIPELQKLFMSKNEANVLKLWPLFVKLLGKMLHRGGPFINSLLHLEELGFRSSSPTIKKIAFIAWKSLIDNFSLNPDILCSAKRIKLLMQPLASIHVRTEPLLLTKVEVWWYLVVQLGPNLASNFDQVSVPLLQCTIGCDGSSVPATPSRAVTQNGAATPGTPKCAATPGFNSPANTSRMSLNCSVQVSTFPSIQLLGLEMLLHYFLGPETVATAAKRKLTLSLEPLSHPLVSGSSSFTKHAAVLISTLRDGFISVGKDAPDALLNVLWTNLVRFVNMTIESGGSKKDRQGSEVLTLMLQALQSIVTSENLPAHKVLVLLEATVKGIPQRVLGSASYQVGKMDVLNGTPALYLVLLLYNSSMLSAYIEDERFFQCLQTLVGCGLSGHTSPLAFAEAVLGAIGGSAGSLQSKEQLWRMWSVMVAPLTDTITQSNEVNQGDALEHNFGAMHAALLFPVTHLLRGPPLQQASQKSMLSTWSKLYKVFARCSSLVVTAEENICCEELCAKMTASMDRDALKVPSTLNAVSSLLQVMVECVDFSPYSPHFQQKLKSPHTPVNWMRKRNKALGNLSTFQSLLVQCLEVYLQAPKASEEEATGVSLVSIMSALFTNLILANAVQEALASLVQPLSLLYKHAAVERPEFTSLLLTKLEKLLGDVLGCVQSRSALAFNDELLALLSPLLCVLFPLKNKQLRTPVIQFWNATFANSVSLTYPEEIRPILSQVKQKIPIILPGFEVVSQDLSGQYSSESSQLETKLSGIPLSSVGKRDSLLGKAAEPKDKGSMKTSKPVSTKLDFGSPKPPRRGVLEEEASIDFVFIPPETKERVLTEHQKEVKRTKRGDIPAMYNNLDASLDTTVFTQYTQSQEDSSEKLQTEQNDKVTKETSEEVPQEDAEIPARATGDCSSPKETEEETENHQDEEMTPEPADVSMEEDSKSGDTAEDMESKDDLSPNVSSSSDLVSGTPQKPNSRRQSFITLEKYAEGKPASPSSTFTGRLGKSSSSQERSKTSKVSPSQSSQISAGPDSLDSQSPGRMDSQNPVSDATESPRRPKDSGIKSEPVRLTERLPSDPSENEDVIPDTQTEAEEMQPSSQEEELNDSQSTSQVSQGETRRSGRRKVKPVLPGEDPESQGDKSSTKRRRSGEKLNNDSPDSTQSRVTRRSQQLSEEASGREKLRTRAQRDKSETSQTDSQGRAHKKIKLQSNSDESLDNPEPKRGRRRITREQESSQTVLQSDGESQSQKKRGLPKRASETNKEVGVKRKVRDSQEKEESSQTDTQVVEQMEKDDDELMNDSQMNSPSPQTGARSQDSEVVEQKEKEDQELKSDSQMISPSAQTDTKSQEFDVGEKEDQELKNDSQMTTPSPQTDTRSQEFELVEQTKQADHELKNDSQLISSSPQTGARSQEFELVEQTEKDAVKPQDSQILTSSQPDGQSLESELVEEAEKEDGSITVSTKEAQDGTDTTNELENESEVKGKPKTSDGVDEELSQEDSEVITPVSSESQSRRRSGRSKASAESEDKSDSQPSSGRGRRSNSKTSAVAQAEGSIGGRTRRSKSTPGSTPESSQSLEVPGSSESSQGRGRYKRKSSQALVPSLESSEAESSQAKEMSVMPKKRGRKPKASLPSPLAADCKIDGIDNHVAKSVVDNSQEEDTQITEAKAETVLDEAQKSPNVKDSESFHDEAEAEEQPDQESPMEEEADAAVASEPLVPEKTEIDDKEGSDVSPSKKEQRDSPTKTDRTSSPESDTEDVEVPEPAGSSNEQLEETLPPAVETLVSLDETIEEPQVSESPEEPQVSESTEDQAEDVSETGDSDKENEQADSDQEHPVVPVEAAPQDENQVEIPKVTDEPSKEEEPSEQPTDHITEEDAAPPPEDDEDHNQMMECQDEEQTQAADAEDDVVEHVNAAPTDPCYAPVFADSSDKDAFQDSPMRQKNLEAVMGLDVGQSPSGGRTRGTWSPSASPSTSILKKGQKRPLEDETPSPLVKSRRVSFANPIQRQELADDIDRRSPAIRTSSPRRSRVSAIPLPKYVTTPTKGLLILSPRNLRSPGSKSSKKCLISEMNQEPRPVPRDCIYPALVGCSAPVEAVLPQISSTLWSRGFGQLVRARNIKTVGDLSALTPLEIKTLPIRSPKISNVKKALKFYEQQRKGRGGDELKSLDEMELMTSELEETSAPQNQEDEDKASGETLATELMDEPVPVDERSHQDVSGDQTPDTPTGGGGEDEGRLHGDGLLSDVDALTCRMTPLELSRCSPLQLVHVHEQLGGLMSRVVGELQTRLRQADGKT